METVKSLAGDLWMKIKLLVGLLLAGLTVGAIAWREHVKNGLAGVEQKAKEEAAKEEAAKKLAEQTAKLEAEAAAKKVAIEAEESKKKQELEAAAKAKADKLNKADTKEVKKEAASVLGLKEKKKGRPKKNE